MNSQHGNSVKQQDTFRIITVSWGCLVQNFEDVTGSAFDDSLIGNADSDIVALTQLAGPGPRRLPGLQAEADRRGANPFPPPARDRPRSAAAPAARADAPPQVAGKELSRNGRLRILPSPKPAIPHPPAPKAPPRRRRHHQDGTLQEDGAACRTMAPGPSEGPRWVAAGGAGEAGARTGPWPWPGWRSSCRWALPPWPAGQIPPAPPSPSA
jgi:hypothetical protein